MLEKKGLYGGMDSDSEDRLVENGDYRPWNTLNIRNSIPDSSSVGAITNIKGNTLVDFDMPGGQNTVIGTYDDVTNKRVIYFVHNENGDHTIMVYSSQDGTVSKLVGNTLLNFSLSHLILHVDVIDDYLLWTDDYNEPSMIIISLAQTGFYDSVLLRQYFDRIAYAPHVGPDELTFESDDTYLQNNVRGKIFKFKYSWVYRDKRESAASPESKIAVPISEPNYLPDGNYQTYINNLINLDIQTGFDLVDTINLYVKEGNTGSWFLAKALKKSDLGIGNNQSYTFSFYNDEAWIPVDQTYINRLFDFVPRLSKCQAQTSDKRIVDSNILEGYNNIVPDATVEAVYGEIDDIDSLLQPYHFNGTSYVPVGSPGTNVTAQETGSVVVQPPTIGITVINIQDTQNFIVSYDFSLGVSTGTAYVERKSTFAQSFASGTTATQIATYFANEINNSTVLSGTVNIPAIPPFIPPSVLTFQTIAYVTSAPGQVSLQVETIQSGLVTLTPQNRILRMTISDNQIRKSLKTGTSYKIGLAYYFTANRSGTVQFTPTMELKVDPYNMHPNNLGSIVARLSINHPPPTGALYYLVVMTENLNKSDYIQIKNGTVSTLGTNYKIYINTIATFNTQYPNAVGVTYDFAAGDRMVLLFDASGNALSEYADVEILSSDDDGGGQFILVANTISTAPVTGGFIELYTPKKTIAQQFFYEIGEVYPISNGYHRGNIQNQTPTQPAIVEFTGDTYFRFRTGSMGFFVEDKSLSDFYLSDSWDRGRPNVIDVEAREIRRPTTSYYSEQFVPETNINGLSTVLDDSFESGDIKYGSIQRTWAEEDKIEFYYQLKTSFRLCSKSMLYSADGSSSVQTSESVLSPESFYDGEYGIGDNPESLAAYANSRYHIDANRGVVLRLGGVGYTPISDYKMSSYFRQLLQERTNFGVTFQAWGVYDVKHGEYIIVFLEVEKTVTTGSLEGDSFEEYSSVTTTLQPVTISFSEPKNRWVTPYSFSPECIGGVNVGVVSFKNGKIWVHDTNPVYNNFYGIQYTSKVQLLSNDQPSVIKFYKNLYTESTHAWRMDASNQFSQETSLEYSDFTEREGVFYAPFLMDVNTAVDLPIINGDPMRCHSMVITLENNQTEETKLFAVNIGHAPSMMTNV